MSVLRPALAALKYLLVMTVVLGVLYPAAIFLVALLAPHQADGSLFSVGSQVAGSTLLGQKAGGPQWFQPRPSASDYSGQTSGGTNLSPVSDAELKARSDRAEALRRENPDALGPIPDDALTASASGLDPDISVAYARWQAPRVAKARGLAPADVVRLIDAATAPALFGFVGQDAVNVTRLNAALAALPGR